MKTILMIPSWYPTKENPFGGSFFREQALALQKNFKIIVLLQKCRKSRFSKKMRLSYIEDDRGLSVYGLEIPSRKNVVLDFIYNKAKCHVKGLKQGVGFYERPLYEKLTKKSLRRIKEKGLLPHFDCVYGLTAQDNASMSRLFSMLYEVPYVVAEHGPFPWPGSTISDRTSDAIENADSFFAISNDKIRQVMLQNIRIKPYYVGNLCDENIFSLCVEKHDVKTFLIVASHSFYKNYPMFIRTMEELKKISTEKFKIVIAGYNSNKGYSQNAEELEKMVENSSIKECTTMVQSVSRQEIPGLYNSCDALVMTSIQEGLPISALEASMSGLPVFSTRCGGVEDYIDDEMGRIVSITDFRALAEHCNDFLCGRLKFDPKKIREKCISIFGTKAFTDRMTEEFNRVMDEHAKNGNRERSIK